MEHQHNNPLKLDLGCGRTKPDGYIGIDLVQIIDGKGNRRVDIVRDFEKHGLPFCDNSVDEIRAMSVLEHLDDLIFVMNECHRVLKVGGTMWGNVPPANTNGALRDPTHKRFFVRETFNYFTGSNEAFPEQPRNPKYANYGIKPWHLVEIDEGLNFKLSPRK